MARNASTVASGPGSGALPASSSASGRGHSLGTASRSATAVPRNWTMVKSLARATVASIRALLPTPGSPRSATALPVPLRARHRTWSRCASSRTRAIRPPGAAERGPGSSVSDGYADRCSCAPAASPASATGLRANRPLLPSHRRPRAPGRDRDRPLRNLPPLGSSPPRSSPPVRDPSPPGRWGRRSRQADHAAPGRYRQPPPTLRPSGHRRRSERGPARRGPNLRRLRRRGHLRTESQVNGTPPRRNLPLRFSNTEI